MRATRDRDRKRKVGFTLVELLVVIAIIGVLVALLLPAIQAAREAARRIQCSNNLKQIGIASLTYEDSNKTLPGGGLYGWNGTTDYKGSRFVRLMPYLEMPAMYDRIDFACNPSTPYIAYAANYPCVDAQMQWLKTNVMKSAHWNVAAFTCPSDTNKNDLNGVASYGFSIGAQRMDSQNAECLLYNSWKPEWQSYTRPPGQTWGSYFGDGDYGHGNAGYTWGETHSSIISGPFARGAWAARLGDIGDGTSNTIMWGEIRYACTDHNREPWFHFNNHWTSTNAPINFNTCDGENGNPPNSNTSTDPCRRNNTWTTSQGFKSKHRGGAYFVLCDGAVRFLPETIEYETYQRLGSRRDGNAVKVPGN